MKVQVTITGLNQKQTFTGLYPSTCDAILSVMDSHEWALSASAKTVSIEEGQQAPYIRKPWHVLPLNGVPAYVQFLDEAGDE